MAEKETITRADGHASKRGLWDQIRARKAAGKKPRKKGEAGAPSERSIRKSQAKR